MAAPGGAGGAVNCASKVNSPPDIWISVELETPSSRRSAPILKLWRPSSFVSAPLIANGPFQRCGRPPSAADVRCRPSKLQRREQSRAHRVRER